MKKKTRIRIECDCGCKDTVEADEWEMGIGHVWCPKCKEKLWITGELIARPSIVKKILEKNFPPQ